MLTRIRNFLRDESGPTAVEYAVMLALIVATCIGAVKQMSQATADSFDDSAGAITAAFG
jgi:pilus assembly protein Flp/PilA